MYRYMHILEWHHVELCLIHVDYLALVRMITLRLTDWLFGVLYHIGSISAIYIYKHWGIRNTVMSVPIEMVNQSLECVVVDGRQFSDQELIPLDLHLSVHATYKDMKWNMSIGFFSLATIPNPASFPQLFPLNLLAWWPGKRKEK